MSNPPEPSLKSLSRRRFFRDLAAAGASLAGSAILASAGRAEESPGPAGPAAKDRTVTCDETTVADTASGKVRGYRRDGVYAFKGIP